MRSDPPMSLPSPSGDMPDASAAASPPLDPPAVRSASQGLRVRPCRLDTVWTRKPMSGRLVRPMAIAPAAFMRSTTGASTGAMTSASAGRPLVVGVPARSMFSFTVNGTPWSGPSASPAETARSAATAASPAPSASTRVTALRCGFTSAMRVRWASTTSTELNSPLAIPTASSRADLRHNSPPMTLSFRSAVGMQSARAPT